MKRTPTRPWEIRNERARLAWIARGRTHTTYEHWRRVDQFTMRREIERHGRTLYSGFVAADLMKPPVLPLQVAPMSDDLRKAYAEIRQETNRLMGLYPRTAAVDHDLDVLLAQELSLTRVVGGDT